MTKNSIIAYELATWLFIIVILMANLSCQLERIRNQLKHKLLALLQRILLDYLKLEDPSSLWVVTSGGSSHKRTQKDI